MLTRINLLSVLITLNCFAISFGSIAPVNARGYGLLAFLLIVVPNTSATFRIENHRLVGLGLRILGMLICLGVILSVNRTYIWVIWYVLLLYLFFDVVRPLNEPLSQMYLVWTAFVFALCYALSFHSSHIWFLLQALSTELSRVLGQITGTQVVLGTTRSGFWIFFSCLLCLFFAYWLYARKQASRRAVFAIATGYLVIGYFAYAAYGQHLFQNLYRTFAKTFGAIGGVMPNFAAVSLSSPLLFLVLAIRCPNRLRSEAVSAQGPIYFPERFSTD